MTNNNHIILKTREFKRNRTPCANSETRRCVSNHNLASNSVPLRELKLIRGKLDHKFVHNFKVFIRPL